MEAKTRRVKVSCCSKTHPCPTCGKRGRRKEILTRDVRSIAFHEIVILEVTSAEYRARCGCCKTFRSSPPGVGPRCWYDNQVRDAVLDRLIEDGWNIRKLLVSMQRDFFLDLSEGFVYDCIPDRVARRDHADYRRWTLENFSGTLYTTNCIWAVTRSCWRPIRSATSRWRSRWSTATTRSTCSGSWRT